jgi:hypothetical protein
MQFNREAYLLLSRRGSVPPREGPRPRFDPDLPRPRGGDRSAARTVRRLVPAARIAVREFRLALDDGGERHRAR